MLRDDIKQLIVANTYGHELGLPDRIMTALKESPEVIMLKLAEIQLNYDRVKWAEDLIEQLPHDHDGRNSWLLNYGKGQKGEPRALPSAPPVKPPVGLLPEKIFEQSRVESILDAMQRYVQGGHHIPIEWVGELRKRLKL